MPREQKTAAELAEMIRHQLGEPELRVAVFPKGNTWYAKVYTAENVERKIQRRADAVTMILVVRYELTESR
jgi:hypothetical protein